jgi:hypothetical protein
VLAGPRALVPGLEFIHAVLGARVGVAVFSLTEGANVACEAAVLGSGDDGSVLKLHATPTAIGALGPFLGPCVHAAVDGACEVVAAGGAVEPGTSIPAHIAGSDDGASLLLGARAAGLGAGAVAGPCGNDAVYATGVAIAFARADDRVACLAAVLRIAQDDTTAVLRRCQVSRCHAGL